MKTEYHRKIGLSCGTMVLRLRKKETRVSVYGLTARTYYKIVK